MKHLRKLLCSLLEIHEWEKRPEESTGLMFCKHCDLWRISSFRSLTQGTSHLRTESVSTNSAETEDPWVMSGFLNREALHHAMRERIAELEKENGDLHAKLKPQGEGES